MKIFLESYDPHPTKSSHLISGWWGKEITVSEPLRARVPHVCGAEFIFEILGPPELLEFIAAHKLGKYACSHQVQTAEIETTVNDSVLREAQL